MEKSDTNPEESSVIGVIKEEISKRPLNTEIEEIVRNYLESEQDLDISAEFSDWILKFIIRDDFLEPESNFKLYDIFEQFNNSLISLRSSIKDLGDTPPTKPSHFEIEVNLIEEIIRRAVSDLRIFEFIKSSKWNELRAEFCGKGEINYECVESLEKLIMFQDLMQIKNEKYKLDRGW